MQNNHQSKYQTIVKAPVDKVWNALIDPKLVKQYFFGSNQDTTWRVGSPIVWTGEYEGTSYKDTGVVLEFVPNKKLAYTYFSSWSGVEDKPENYLHVTYEVRPVISGTELTIIQSNYSEEKAKHSESNWAIVIDGLKQLVE